MLITDQVMVAAQIGLSRITSWHLQDLHVLRLRKCHSAAGGTIQLFARLADIFKYFINKYKRSSGKWYVPFGRVTLFSRRVCVI